MVQKLISIQFQLEFMNQPPQPHGSLWPSTTLRDAVVLYHPESNIKRGREQEFLIKLESYGDDKDQEMRNKRKNQQDDHGRKTARTENFPLTFVG